MAELRLDGVSLERGTTAEGGEDLEWDEDRIAYGRLSLHNAIRDHDAPRISLAVNDGQQVAFRIGRQFARFGQDKSAGVRFCQSKALVPDDEESLNVCRVTVLAIDAHD